MLRLELPSQRRGRGLIQPGAELGLPDKDHGEQLGIVTLQSGEHREIVQRVRGQVYGLSHDQDGPVMRVGQTLQMLAEPGQKAHPTFG